MKMSRLLFLVCSGLFVVFGLSGCGDNPCDDSPCVGKLYVVSDSCLVIEEDDYACLCCKPASGSSPGIACDEPGIKLPDPPPPDLDELVTRWDENLRTCYVVE
jgi:hypothetical protein